MSRSVRLRVIEPTSARDERELAGQAAALTFGRGDKADWKIEELSLSRLHARFRWEAGQLSVEDLGSLNGVAVNRHLLEPMKPAAVRPGDRIQIGVVTIQIDGPDDAPSEAQSATVYRPVTLAPEVDSAANARARQRTEAEVRRAKAQGRATLRFIPMSDAASPEQKTRHYTIGAWPAFSRYFGARRGKRSESHGSSRWVGYGIAALLGATVVMFLMPGTRPAERSGPQLESRPREVIESVRLSSPTTGHQPFADASAPRLIAPSELRDAIFAYSEADYPRALDLYRRLQVAQPQDEAIELVVRILERKVSPRP